MYTLNAPLGSLETGLSRQALSNAGSGGAHPAPSEWALLSREMMIMLQNPINGREDQVERWRRLSRAIYDFIETRAQAPAPRREPADRAPPVKTERLTARQRQVMELVVEGRANKVIAYLLNISVRTVENHRATVMKKTGVRTLPDLVRVALNADEPSHRGPPPKTVPRLVAKAPAE